MHKRSLIARRLFSEAIHRRDDGLTTPPGIIRHDDIAYGPDPLQRLDVYRPDPSEGKLPVIINVHGGGWVQGTKEDYQYYTMSLAAEGFAAVNFSYRLAPDFQHPAQLEDINEVVRWVLANAETEGFDLSHIFGIGDSAGAHLLSLYACICTNPSYAACYDFRVPEGFVPTALILNSGLYFMTRKGGVDRLSLLFMDDFLPFHGTEEEFRLITPLNFINGAFPPTLIMTSGNDFLRNHAPLLSAKLLQEGVQHTMLYFPEEPHVFHLDIRKSVALRCKGRETEFLRSFL